MSVSSVAGSATSDDVAPSSCTVALCEWTTRANLFIADSPSTVTLQFAFSLKPVILVWSASNETLEDCSNGLGCRLGSYSSEQVKVPDVPCRSKRKTLQLDSTNVLSPHSLQCTFLYPRCSIEDPVLGDRRCCTSRCQLRHVTQSTG